MRIMLMSLFLIGIGYFLVFQYRDAMVAAIERRRRNSPDGTVRFEKILLSPIYIWSVRFLGLILLAASAVAMWLLVTSPDLIHEGN